MFVGIIKIRILQSNTYRFPKALFFMLKRKNKTKINNYKLKKEKQINVKRSRRQFFKTQ